LSWKAYPYNGEKIKPNGSLRLAAEQPRNDSS